MTSEDRNFVDAIFRDMTYEDWLIETANATELVISLCISDASDASRTLGGQWLQLLLDNTPKQ